MQEIKCPKCGEVFQVDESGYAAIVKQVRDHEFQKEINERERAFATEKQNAIEIAVSKTASERERELAEKNTEIIKLKGDIELQKANAYLEIKNAMQDKDAVIAELKNQMELLRGQSALKEQALKSQHEAELKIKDEEIAHYKDFKSKQSTKMVGESLEQHCEIEFNKLRATAFPNAYFEKDNDARTGSKGDFIYRESSPDGVEFISIMFAFLLKKIFCAFASAPGRRGQNPLRSISDRTVTWGHPHGPVFRFVLASQ